MAATLAALSPATPASAGPTTVDAVVTQGALTISAQPSSATLTGAQFNASLPSQATGQFGSITVSDGRGLATPWSLSAASTNFTGQTDNTKVVDLGVGNPLSFGAVASPTVGPQPTSGACAVTGGNLVAANTGVAIAGGSNALLQLNPVTCTFDPALTLNVPANTPAQTYRGTVTLTVA
jgi:hypothetical protein